ncbi:DUF6144 family protein [Halanaerobium saccharolyticum]|uniref:DUF6144 family protein n=1 Tax=Halanaerobium saccharolyticum TaxID=43595 RepID=UPI003FCC8D9F
MQYQETGRFGRITKNLRKLGFENEMPEILFDSSAFPELKKSEQSKYVETVVKRMESIIGPENTEQVLFQCGAKCCGKSWSKFVQNIWDDSNSLPDFFYNLNQKEAKYNTEIEYNELNNSITVSRKKCICGLINKGTKFVENTDYCSCSIGHMSEFFSTIFKIKNIELLNSIYAGDDRCEWLISIKEKDSKESENNG